MAEAEKFASEGEDFKAPSKKRLKLSKEICRERRFDISTSAELEEAAKGFCPKNTRRSTDWALRVFRAWRDQRNLQTEEKCPSNLLEKPCVPLLNKWLSAFVMEARREDGKRYPPTTLSQLLAGLWRYVRARSQECPSLFDKRERKFDQLHRTLQTVFRQLREEGVGASVKHAPVITAEEEELLWCTKTIGDHSPVALQRAVFYYVGKVFCLRGGEEQRGLKPSQFTRSTDPNGYTYTKNGSKNLSGTDLCVPNKIVPVLAQPEKQQRCLVYLLDLYLAKLPLWAKENDIFYCRPTTRRELLPSSPWYEASPVGKNKLSTFVQVMCREAGISDKKTNHSLRVTGATAMFTAGIPEMMIRDVTGHRSAALQTYERPSLQQRQAVTSVLMSGEDNENEPSPPASLPAGKVTSTQQKACISKSSMLGSMFAGLEHCTININPHNLVINMSGPQQQFDEQQEDCEEFDAIISAADLTRD